MSQDLKNRIMRRVYFIWFLRYLVKDVLVKAFGLALIVLGLKQAVFVSAVFQNISMASRHLGTFVNFSLDAVGNAGPYVLFLFFGAGVITGFLLRDLAYIGSKLILFLQLNPDKRKITA